MSKSELGPSYSFWLPWDEVGGPQTEISLIARFEPNGGSIVIGEQTKHLLPGETDSRTGIVNNVPPRLPDGIPMRPAAPTLASLAEQTQPQAANEQVQLASYDRPAGLYQQPAPPQRRMTTTSISLPENFRVQGGGSPQTVQTGNVVLPGNMVAVPQAPPYYGAVAAPINVPQPGTVSNVRPTMRPMQQLPQSQAAYPGFMTPQQSPLGNGFIAPLGQPHFAPQPVPNGTGQIGAPPPAPMMAGQTPLTTASGWATVSYPPAAGQAGSATVLPQPSFGYPQQSLQAPATPAFR
jgi:hypothetical protein